MSFHEPKQTQSPTVPVKAKQGEDTQQRLTSWPWVQAAVWTPRMLAALDNGVKGGKWFSLIDKVYAPQTLQAAFDRVRRNQGAPGVDGQTVEQYAADCPSNLTWLQAQLQRGTYQPLPIRRRMIPKPGTSQERPLGIPAVRDRVVQSALRYVLEPIFEKKFVAHSYGFRPRRGCKDALRRVDCLLKQGYRYVVDADIHSFFDTVDLGILRTEVEKDIADNRVLSLLDKYLQNAVMESMRGWTPGRGVPQGAVISPLLANIYLHPVDEALVRVGFEVVRYADDLVILCRTQKQAEEALALLTQQITERKLTLHPEKTRIADANSPQGFEFLGYRFAAGKKYPRRKSYQKLKEKIRDKTPRKSGKGLSQIIKELNPMLQGWYEYFKHIQKTWLRDVDQIVRRRLRAMLLRFHKKRGFGAGYANQTWPNAFFAEAGLFSMYTAWQKASRA